MFTELMENPMSKAKTYTKDFEAFWDIVWRKVGKHAAFVAWKTAVKRIVANSESSADEAKMFLLERATLFGNSPKGNKGQYSPHPRTWLQQGRYEDDVEEWFAYDLPDRTIQNVDAATRFINGDD